MAPYAIEAVALLVVFPIIWRLLKRLVLRSPLSNVAGPPSGSWWSGNIFDLFSPTSWDFHDKLAKEYGGAVRVHGFFREEQLYTFDPLALHDIFIKYQHIYEASEHSLVSSRNIFGTSLLSTIGDHHKKQRKMLNPVFSLKHMRGLIPIFYPIAYQLRDALSNEVLKGGKDVNVLSWMSRAALEYIGQAGLGHSFGPIREKSKYNEAVRMLVPLGNSLEAIRQLLPRIEKLGPAHLRRKLIDFWPNMKLKQLRDIVDIMDDTAVDVYKKAKEGMEKGDEELVNRVGQGKDIMSILLKANNEKKDAEKLSDDEMLGHINTFVFAGHDTSTAAISRILHLLVLHPEVQDNLRKEVTEARTRFGDPDYDTLMGLPYLDSVVRESLRMYPPGLAVTRTTREDVTLPLSRPVKSADGKHDINAIPLKKGTEVIVSITNANRNPNVWGPDANEWKPERWLSPLPQSVADAHMPGVYASMMTFIGGGRACIGFKFAEMEIKLVLSVLLETFKFSPGSREIQWSTNAIYTPHVIGSEDTTPRLPLNVSFVKA